MMKTLAVVLGLYSAVLLARDRVPGARNAPTTVVLISIDTLRADAVSFMGCEAPTSPFLDSLAASGVIFDRAYSTSSWTVPAMASIFTSRHPSSHGVVRGEIIGGKTKEVWRQTSLSPELPNLAEIFRGAGYRTVGVAANRHLQAGTGFELGFDHYYGYAGFLNAEDLNATLQKTMAEAFGEDWRKTWKNEKTFLWIHYFDPHHPYLPRKPWIEAFDPEFRTRPELFPWRLKAPELNAAFSAEDTETIRRLRALYHSEVRYADEQLRSIYTELGLDENALVVFVSDHGEEFGERGKIGHRWTLNEELVHVPMFVSWPARLPRGKRVGDVVSIVDILPTMAELASLEVPGGVEGQSLVKHIDGASRLSGGVAYLELHPPNPALRALVSDRWKLVLASHNRVELYDLRSDPGERKDVAAEHKEMADLLEARFNDWFGSLPEPPEAEDFSSRDQKDIEKLRALGYVDE
jgi:arylsulfatase A-like enzyme